MTITGDKSFEQFWKISTAKDPARDSGFPAIS
jgi:hypothetical protein